MTVLPALIVFMTAGAAMAQVTTAPSEGVPDGLHGRRILIIVANAADDPSLLEQRQSVKTDAAGYCERDVAIVEIINGAGAIDGRPITPGQSQSLAKLASISSRFGVALVGRDGGLKLAKSDPVASDTVFALIDSMPMRQREMHDKSH
jgi:hypothetical protein